jgi:hypothetical protein
MYRPNSQENPFELPSNLHLTTEQIEYTEIVINELLRGLLVNEELREHHIAMSLPHKIEGCINFADFAAQDPSRKIGPELGQALRKLLTLVNDYYIKLN